MKYVALLRGISPTEPAMSNANLRQVFQDLGYKEVTSVISSGNILFDSNYQDVAKLERDIESAINKRLGFKTTAMVRKKEQIEDILKLPYFRGLTHNNNTYLTVTFLKNSPDSTGIFKDRPTMDKYGLVGFRGREVFCVTDMSSPGAINVIPWLEQQVGKGITTRTWSTVQKIDKRFKDS